MMSSEDRALTRPDALRAEPRSHAEVLLERFVAAADPFAELVGSSAAHLRVLQQARLAARTNVPVLLTGETGTGKELVAAAIHRASDRAARPFVTVHAGAISAGLVESELFGHERGAFTGARERRQGKLVAADGGTFFLDEIGELPLASQTKLLRALQEKVVVPVGGLREVASDFRLISATHRDLGRMAAEGRFRDDLRYRLNVLEIRLPPLRDRIEDVPALVRRLLEVATRRYGVPPCGGFDDAALELLRIHRWPGNIRELEGVVYRAALFAGGQPIDASHVRRALAMPRSARRRELPPPAARRLEDVVREAVGEALRKNQGNLSAAARQLDISRVTLYRKAREYALLPPSSGKASDG